MMAATMRLTTGSAEHDLGSLTSGVLPKRGAYMAWFYGLGPAMKAWVIGGTGALASIGAGEISAWTGAAVTAITTMSLAAMAIYSKISATASEARRRKSDDEAYALTVLAKANLQISIDKDQAMKMMMQGFSKQLEQTHSAIVDTKAIATANHEVGVEIRDQVKLNGPTSSDSIPTRAAFDVTIHTDHNEPKT